MAEGLGLQGVAGHGAVPTAPQTHPSTAPNPCTTPHHNLPPTPMQSQPTVPPHTLCPKCTTQIPLHTLILTPCIPSPLHTTHPLSLPR